MLKIAEYIEPERTPPDLSRLTALAIILPAALSAFLIVACLLSPGDGSGPCAEDPILYGP